MVRGRRRSGSAVPKALPRVANMTTETGCVPNSLVSLHFNGLGDARYALYPFSEHLFICLYVEDD